VGSWAAKLQYYMVGSDCIDNRGFKLIRGHNPVERPVFGPRSCVIGVLVTRKIVLLQVLQHLVRQYKLSASNDALVFGT